MSGSEAGAVTPAQAAAHAFITGCAERGIPASAAAVPPEGQLAPVRGLWRDVASAAIAAQQPAPAAGAMTPGQAAFAAHYERAAGAPLTMPESWDMQPEGTQGDWDAAALAAITARQPQPAPGDAGYLGPGKLVARYGEALQRIVDAVAAGDAAAVDKLARNALGLTRVRRPGPFQPAPEPDADAGRQRVRLHDLLKARRERDEARAAIRAMLALAKDWDLKPGDFARLAAASALSEPAPGRAGGSGCPYWSDPSDDFYGMCVKEAYHDREGDPEHENEHGIRWTGQRWEGAPGRAAEGEL